MKLDDVVLQSIGYYPFSITRPEIFCTSRRKGRLGLCGIILLVLSHSTQIGILSFIKVWCLLQRWRELFPPARRALVNDYSPLPLVTLGSLAFSVLFLPSLRSSIQSFLNAEHSPTDAMALPSFLPVRHQKASPSTASRNSEKASPSTRLPSATSLKQATRTRSVFAFFTSFCFLVSLIFLILVEVGNISGHRRVVGSIWFLKLNLSNIIAQSVPNAALINSIARTLGLHDFYQVGLWNFCEGYGSQITDCSKPRKLYWFNPVDIIISELLAGATSTLVHETLHT